MRQSQLQQYLAEKERGLLEIWMRIKISGQQLVGHGVSGFRVRGRAAGIRGSGKTSEKKADDMVELCVPFILGKV